MDPSLLLVHLARTEQPILSDYPFLKGTERVINDLYSEMAMKGFKNKRECRI